MVPPTRELVTAGDYALRTFTCGTATAGQGTCGFSWIKERPDVGNLPCLNDFAVVGVTDHGLIHAKRPATHRDAAELGRKLR